jgi:C-terminal processing protease CtpA/Prc
MLSLLLARRIVVPLAVAFASLTLAQEPPRERMNLEIFEAAWEAVDRNFFDPNHLGADWAQAKERHRAGAVAAKSDQELSAAITAMLREIRASHLDIRPPADKVVWAMMGVSTVRLGDKTVVKRVTPGSDAQRAGIVVGDVVLEPRQLYGTLGEVGKVRLVGRDDQERVVEARFEHADWPPEEPPLRWRSIRQDGKTTIGVITITSFTPRTAELIEPAMEDLRDASAIIFDIRGNSGGDASSLKILSYFNQGSPVGLVMMARPALSKLGRMPQVEDIQRLRPNRGVYRTEQVMGAILFGGGAAVFYPEDMGDKRYDGKIVVLVDERSGSSSEGFGHGAKIAGATIVGRRTPGALLSGQPFTLPHGWSTSYRLAGFG